MDATATLLTALQNTSQLLLSNGHASRPSRFAALALQQSELPNGQTLPLQSDSDTQFTFSELFALSADSDDVVIEQLAISTAYRIKAAGATALQLWTQTLAFLASIRHQGLVCPVARFIIGLDTTMEDSFDTAILQWASMDHAVADFLERENTPEFVRLLAEADVIKASTIITAFLVPGSENSRNSSSIPPIRARLFKLLESLVLNDSKDVGNDCLKTSLRRSLLLSTPSHILHVFRAATRNSDSITNFLSRLCATKEFRAVLYKHGYVIQRSFGLELQELNVETRCLMLDCLRQPLETSANAMRGSCCSLF